MSDYLPTDVLVEILSRLPVKALLRFTAVSKKWYLLIFSPSFISKHLEHSISIPTSKNHFLLVRCDYISIGKRVTLRLVNDMLTYAELESPFSRKFEDFTIVGTCNGLICLADAHDAIVIWNPCVKRPINLPNPIFPIPHGAAVLGFGYDSVSNDYKVVRIVNRLRFRDYFSNQMPPDVEIYSLSTKVWSSICDIAPMYYVFNCSPAFVNGHIHWLASKRYQNVMLSGFNVSNEVFSEVEIPETLAKIEVSKLAVFLWDKSIALVEYDNSWENEYCWVWKMKEYNVVESWDRVLKIDVRQGLQKVVSLKRTNVLIFTAKGKGYVTYDPHTKHIQSLGRVVSLYHFLDNFVESLVLVEGQNGELFELGSSSTGGVDHDISNLELEDDTKTNEQV